ncbi:unnamed protein product, partial [Symbiodinium necroappetens]
EAARLRRKYPDMILSSRMVRRKKPIPGIGKWKPKSRWCLAGHSDPDTAELVTFAPTPSSEGLMAFLQVSLNLSHTFAFCDVKNAFCQSDKLVRKGGPLFAQPCEGLHLGDDALIIIDVLIEVDDFIVTALPELQSKLKEAFQARFTFGKWEENEAEYAGRMIKVHPGFIHIDQEKYLTEQVRPVALAKHRRSCKQDPLNSEEFEAFRSAIYKVNWVAKETRPEVAGMASILASKLKSAVIEDVLVLNKNINFLRNTAARPLTIWKMDAREMAFVVVSDAGGIGAKHDTTDELDLPADSTQGAWMVFAAEALPLGNMKVRASPLAWRSSKLRRKVFSTFGGETQAMLQGISEADWLQIMVRDAVQHDVELRQWRNSLSPHMVVMKGDLH